MRILIFLGLFFSLSCAAQNTIGIPQIINYSKQDYNAGTQNWDIRQDKNGIMFFANNDGLLSFDGTTWKTFPLPKKTNVRSVEISIDDKIYVGGQDEIGYFSADKKGVLAYTSLKNLIPSGDNSFADVWDVIIYENSVFFHSTSKIFRLTAGKMYSYSDPHWRFMGLSNNVLIAQTNDNRLLAYDNGNWRPFLKKGGLPKHFMVTGFLPLSHGRSMIITLKNGIYIVSGDEALPLSSADLNAIAPKRIYGACRIDSNEIALATNLGGCFIINNTGKLIQRFSTKEGLQNNNVLSISLDRNKNLWLGLDNGIDFIAYNSAIRHIYPGNQDEGSGYTSAIYHGRLYLGTSNGLYSIPFNKTNNLGFSKGDFEPVANSKGQVWNLCDVNGKLLMGHHDGAFLIENNAAVLLDSSSGFWSFLPFENRFPATTMIAGTYKGINFYMYQNSRFINKNLRVPFLSARFMTVDNNTIWISHPYKGIFKIDMVNGKLSGVKSYTNLNGLVSENNNYIYKIKKHIVVATEKGLYEYNRAKDRFEPSAYFRNIFGEKSIRYVREDIAGNIWFISEKSLGVVDMTGKKPQTIYFPELNNKMVSGFEHIYPLDSTNVLLGAEKGFYHINYASYKKSNNQLDVFIRTVKAFNKKDSLLFGGYVNEHTEKFSTVDHAWNSFHFEYSSTLFEQWSNIEYSYKLEGFDANWSDWSKKTEKEYTNLPAGTYVFLVKTKNNFGSESLPDKYAITVLPAWYESKLAYLLYAVIFFTGCYILYKEQKKKFIRQQKRHEEEQKHLQYLHQLEMDKAEKELVKLRNEKLEAELQLKNKELASSSLHLVHKSETLLKIKNEFVKLKNNVQPSSPKDLKKISKMFGNEIKVDSDWENFAVHFDKVHSEFLLSLKERYPNFNVNDLKLASYLRMNLSTKEIAQLMNISVRGVEISRYRFRKKLKIPARENLCNYLLNFNIEMNKSKDTIESVR